MPEIHPSEWGLYWESTTWIGSDFFVGLGHCGLSGYKAGFTICRAPYRSEIEKARLWPLGVHWLKAFLARTMKY